MLFAEVILTLQVVLQGRRRFLLLRGQPEFSNSYLNNKISDYLHWYLSLHIIYVLILSIDQDQPGIQKQTFVPFVHSFHRF